jgi:hypothetical protein
MKRKDAENFESNQAQMEGVYEEIGLLSKKKPDEPVSKFKLKYINEVLIRANNALGKEYCPLKDFKLFDEADLPAVSDVVFIVSLYLKSMDEYRYDNTHTKSGYCYWTIEEDGKGGDMRTKHSKKSRML